VGIVKYLRRDFENYFWGVDSAGVCGIICVEIDEKRNDPT
jgi:hypothetical protein